MLNSTATAAMRSTAESSAPDEVEEESGSSRGKGSYRRWKMHYRKAPSQRLPRLLSTGTSVVASWWGLRATDELKKERRGGEDKLS